MTAQQRRRNLEWDDEYGLPSGFDIGSLGSFGPYGFLGSLLGQQRPGVGGSGGGARNNSRRGEGTGTGQYPRGGAPPPVVGADGGGGSGWNGKSVPSDMPRPAGLIRSNASVPSSFRGKRNDDDGDDLLDSRGMDDLGR
jgi:hypothetical protein